MTRQITKLSREGDYVAEVDVIIIDDNGPGSPYLPLSEARKLDAVRGHSKG